MVIDVTELYSKDIITFGIAEMKKALSGSVILKTTKVFYTI